MPPGRRDPGHLVVAPVVASVVASVVTLVVCWRSFGSGVVLYRDFVAVPEPVFGASTWGADGAAPRAVPLDAVVTALAALVPPGVQQQVMLAATVFLAAVGAGLLVRGHGRAAVVTSSVLSGWNPFVAERLLLGQPPTLLAYSMTPWLVLAVRSRVRGPAALLAVVVAALPAALTPWGSLWAAAIAVGTALVTRHRSRRWTAGVAALAVLWCLPWVVAALRHGSAGADPDGARAFALRSDSVAGVLWSALTLGGSWAPAAVPDSRATPLAMAASAVLVVGAVAGLVVLARARRRTLAGLLALAWAGPAVAASAVSGGPGLAAFTRLQEVPGVAIARDTHRWLALTALAAALLTGVAVGSVGRAVRSLGAAAGAVPAAPVTAVPSTTVRSTAVRVAAGLVATSAAVLAVPDLPSGVAAAYRPQAWPADWAPAVRAAERAAGDGRVLALPWMTFRRPGWAATGAPFLDPTSRALTAPVLQSRELVVARPGDPAVVVDDDVRAVSDVARADRLQAASLAGLGVRAVVVWLDTPGRLPTPGEGVVVVHRSEHFEVWSVTR